MSLGRRLGIIALIQVNSRQQVASQDKVGTNLDGGFQLQARLFQVVLAAIRADGLTCVPVVIDPQPGKARGAA